MIKNILIVLFLVVCNSAFGQNIPGEEQYGFRIGLSSSTLSGDVPEDLERRLGLHANFFIEFPVGKMFSLQPELGITALGVNENAAVFPDLDVIDAKTNWLTLSVLAKINMGKFHLLVGPQVGANVTENEDNDQYAYTYAVTGGIGVYLWEGFALDARYGYGLNNVFDNEYGDNFDAQNRYIQVGLSYKL